MLCERLSRWRGFRANGSAAAWEGGVAGRIAGRSLRRYLSIGGAGLTGRTLAGVSCERQAQGKF